MGRRELRSEETQGAKVKTGGKEKTKGVKVIYLISLEHKLCRERKHQQMRTRQILWMNVRHFIRLIPVLEDVMNTFVTAFTM